MRENNIDQEFEHLPDEQLAEILRKFYGTVLTKTRQEYSKSGMINLHSGINRHLHSPPFKRSSDLMNDRVFTQANLIFSGCLRDNKERGLDTASPRTAIEQEDVQKLFNDYFPLAIADTLNTEILLHKVFFDIMYYTGHRGKEGLRSLTKSSFIVKESANGKEFIEITFNEKTKKNQGDSMSAAANALHNDHHVITAIENSPLCPVESYKRYVHLLNPNITAFFQYPNKAKTGFTREPIGKNMLGNFMKEISTAAKLSKQYTNHQIRKTTATGMHRSGFTLEQIANVTKHKNLDSLKHYVSAPTLKEKENYNEGLFSYGARDNKEVEKPQQNQSEDKQSDASSPPKKKKQEEIKENSPNRELLLTQYDPLREVDNNQTQRSGIQNVVTTNKLRQAPNLFQNASFTNCNFNFTLPQ